jgi:UrcA family protein
MSANDAGLKRISTMARLSPLALAAAVIATSLSVIAPAGAQSARDPNVRIVHYGDLDLTTAAGRASLARRVRSAVNRLCHDNRQLDLDTIERCRADVMDATRPKVDLALRDSASRVANADGTFSTALR